jgi:hypothetical protein
MQYKTIVLELLEQRPETYEHLRSQRMLLSAVDRFSQELKTRHESWIEELYLAKPQSEASQISSEALEIALQELERHLSGEPAESGEPSLEGAMAFLRRHMPPV